MKLQMKLNGQQVEWEVVGNELLLDLLRDRGFHGTKRGCENGDCGCCAVQIDGKTLNSCIYLAGQAQGRAVTTIEGVGTMKKPHPLQTALVETGGVQCGFCIPGIILSAKELLEATPNPKETDIREALDGNLCRCTGYTKQFEAIKNAAKVLTGKKPRGSKAASGGGK